MFQDEATAEAGFFGDLFGGWGGDEASPDNPYRIDPMTGWLYYNDQRVRYVPAFDVRGKMQEVKGIVLHYGAGTHRSDVNILTRQDNIYISAQLGLPREGAATQMAPMDMVCLHCGDGPLPAARPYGGRTSNYCLIGIEIENLGWLNVDMKNGQVGRKAGRGYVTWEKDDCIYARHPIRGGQAMWWPKYTESQRQHVDWLIEAIKAAYPTVRFLVAHDEISRHKYDISAAWDMDASRDLHNLRGV